MICSATLSTLEQSISGNSSKRGEEGEPAVAGDVRRKYFVIDAYSHIAPLAGDDGSGGRVAAFL